MKLKYDEKYYIWLDSLRSSGIVNMFGAHPYLMREFPELDTALAKKILVDWMETFPRKTIKVPGNIDDDPENANWLHQKKRRRK